MDATTTISTIEYRGYTIEPSWSPFGGYDYFPTQEGRNDDYDLVGEGFQYCGNVGHASTIEEAKMEIFEKIMTSQPLHVVQLDGRQLSFAWIEDAIKFAAKWNGELFLYGQQTQTL